MKAAKNNSVISSGQMGKDLELVKRIVPIFKKSYLNAKLSSVMSQIQGAETFFGYFQDFVEILMKSDAAVRSLVDKRDFEAAKKASIVLSSLFLEELSHGARLYPTLMSIIVCYSPLYHSEKEIEGSTSPIIMKLFLL